MSKSKMVFAFVGTTGSGGAGGAGTSGSGGAGGASGACTALLGSAGTSTGTMSWEDNGVSECAFLALVDRTIATVADTIEVDASTADSRLVDFALSAYPGPLGGTYSCENGNGASVPDVMFEVVGSKTSGFSTMSNCSITISFSTDSAGTEHAQGTFSGSVTGDGGTDVITDGMFDLTVMLTGG